ncbi:hypothetical protein BX260_7920 [Streptomyces sp. 5112.2]|nr:hypothetical protein BX260_7920 [Streptomyces sp. 5112.2]
MGSSEKQWRQAVNQLVRMKKEEAAPHHGGEWVGIVGVRLTGTGTGLRPPRARVMSAEPTGRRRHSIVIRTRLVRKTSALGTQHVRAGVRFTCGSIAC